MSRAGAIEKKVVEIIDWHLGTEVGTVGRATHLVNDLSVGSQDLADLVLDLEDEYKIHIDAEALESLKTVGDVCNFIETATAKAAA
jgi:acyl carrier protein